MHNRIQGLSLIFLARYLIPNCRSLRRFNAVCHFGSHRGESGENFLAGEGRSWHLARSLARARSPDSRAFAACGWLRRASDEFLTRTACSCLVLHASQSEHRTPIPGWIGYCFGDFWRRWTWHFYLMQWLIEAYTLSSSRRWVSLNSLGIVQVFSE